MVKVDLHTHSIISPDGGVREDEYKKLLRTGILDCIAITDHNDTKFAKKLNEKLGNRIIIGEEITTTEGEMIGLFLTKTIPAGLTAKATAKTIREQGGLVYIPHPFETARQGIQRPVLEEIIDVIDIIEVFNGRGKGRGKNKEAETFCAAYHLAGAASSDAHGFYGIGRTFSTIEEIPTHSTLKNLLVHGAVQKTYAPFFAYLYPTFHKVRRLFHL